MTFAIVGTVVPGGVGRVFMAIGLLTSASTLCYAYARRDGTGAEVAAWMWNPLSQPEAPLLGLALLMFPDGRLPRPAGARPRSCWRSPRCC